MSRVKAQAIVVAQQRQTMKKELTEQMTHTLTKSLSDRIKVEVEKEQKAKISQEVGLQVQAVAGASILGLEQATSDLESLLNDDAVQTLAKLIPTIGNLCKNVGLINSRVRNNVKMLQTCESKKRKREEEDVAKSDKEATNQNSIQRFFTGCNRWK